MAKQTLLELTQNILTAMEDDEVNSISDTVSSMSVAQTVIDCYNELVVELSLPGEQTLSQLESLSDVAHPNYLRMPDNVSKLLWVKYNNLTVSYVTPRFFFDFVIKRDEGVTVNDITSGVPMKISTTTAPTYWTSFDDEYIVFDSFDITLSSTLLTVNTAALIEKEHNLALSDASVPNLPSTLFPTLLSKSKARCFVNFKQVANTKEDQAERRGLVRHQNDMKRVAVEDPMDRLPNYAKPRRASYRRTSKRSEAY